GPQLYAVARVNNASPPADQSTLSATKLLGYPDFPASLLTPSGHLPQGTRCYQATGATCIYSDNDLQLGGAVLGHGSKQAVVLAHRQSLGISSSVTPNPAGGLPPFAGMTPDQSPCASTAFCDNFYGPGRTFKKGILHGSLSVPNNGECEAGTG